MIRYLMLLIIIVIQHTCYSQIDKSEENYSLNIPALDEIKLSKEYPIKLSPVVGLTDKGFSITMNIKPIDGFAKKKYGITETRDVVDPTWEIKQQFSEAKKDVSKFDRDYYLGDIKTKSKYIRIVCRDHEYEDGDRIKLLLNEAIIHPNITLKNTAYVIDVELKKA